MPHLRVRYSKFTAPDKYSGSDEIPENGLGIGGHQNGGTEGHTCSRPALAP